MAFLRLGSSKRSTDRQWAIIHQHHADARPIDSRFGRLQAPRAIRTGGGRICPVQWLLHELQISILHFERKALPDGGQSDNHFTLLSKLRDYALGALEDSDPDPHRRTNCDVRMWTQQKSARQPFANLIKLGTTHQAPVLIA